MEYCNWTFWEVIRRSNKWGIQRDCDSVPLVEKPGVGPYEYSENVTKLLLRGDSREWRAYKASLQPQVQARHPYPLPGAQCPNCHKEINGVNPYDDGETWRR